MKYYCVKVDNEYYRGFQGEKGFLTEVNNCTMLSEKYNYKKLYEDAKRFYPESEVKLLEVAFIEKEIEL